VELDPAINEPLHTNGAEAVLSDEGAGVDVLVVKTDEELMIARDTAGLLG
jgi:acetate kinase